MSAFAGLQVVDLAEGFAGALAVMILGDNGADVVRLVPPAEEDRDPIDRLAGARQWRRSSRLLIADDAEAAGHLMATADVVVLSSEGWVWKLLDRRADDLRAAHPALVVAAIDGDMDDGVVHARSGRMADWGRMFGLDRPAFVAPPLASYATAMGLLQGIAAALHVRARTGAGQVVRTELVRGQMAFDLFGPGPRVQPSGPTRPTSRALAPHPYLPYIPARAKDGRWIQWANWAPHLFWQHAELLGLGHLRDDPRFAALPGPVDNDAGHEWWDHVLDATATKTADEWMTILRETGAAGGDVFTHTVDGMDHPQVRHNGHVVTAADGSEQLGPIAIRHDPPPNLRANRGFGARDPHAGSRRGPLGDVIVIEAATMIAAPTAPALLADLGARVIKVEPIGGEPGRAMPFLKMMQGKESICIDLKTPEGGEIFRRLAARADILMHNYRPGVPDKLGIDYTTLAADNPGLIYVYVGAYGADGPYVKMPAYHPIPGAVCGAAALQAGAGTLDGPLDLPREELRARSLRLSRANETHPDAATGLLAATAALIALIERDRDPAGAGQEMTVTMLAANAYVMSDDWIRYPGRPSRPPVDADLLGTGPLNRLCATSDGWEFVSGATRVRADGGGFAALLQADIATGDARLSQEVETPGVGRHWRAGPIVELEGMAPVGGACVAGQHTTALLDELGYSQDEINSLLERDIAGIPPLS